MQTSNEAMQSLMTPIRVRGKRGAAPGEKWHANKKKKEWKKLEDSSSLPVNTMSSAEAPKSRPKRRTARLSMLEALPTEILQDIFDLSGNVDLPCTSPALQSKLSSHSMYRQLTVSILQHVVRSTQQPSVRFAPEHQLLRDANRLFACRFLTRDTFRGAVVALHQRQRRATVAESSVRELWLALSPVEGLLPPVKLLRGPWDDDKLDFLSALWTQPLNPDSQRYAVAFDGLRQAVSAGNLEVTAKFLDLAVRPDQEVLRTAVTDAKCPVSVVAHLLYADLRTSREINEQSAVDCLDPVIWAWAGRAESEGIAKATECMEMLRYRADCAGMRLPVQSFRRRFAEFMPTSTAS